jgi:hypothetical protein
LRAGLIGHQNGADCREVEPAQLGARDGVQEPQIAAIRSPGEHRDPPVGQEGRASSLSAHLRDELAGGAVTKLEGVPLTQQHTVGRRAHSPGREAIELLFEPGGRQLACGHVEIEDLEGHPAGKYPLRRKREVEVVDPHPVRAGEGEPSHLMVRVSLQAG